jgi:hypothetical protein
MSATRPPVAHERPAEPIEASRRGAHRVRPAPLTTGVPVALGLAVVMLVAGATWLTLGRSPGATSGSSVAAAPTLSGTVSASATASASASATASPTAAASSAEPEATSSPSASRASAAPVNRRVGVVVLNSISVQGLAKQVQASLVADRWRVLRTDNSRTRNLPVTRVYYGKASLKATAKAVRRDLGYGEVIRDAGVSTNGIVVVLGRDSTT